MTQSDTESSISQEIKEKSFFYHHKKLIFLIFTLAVITIIVLVIFVVNRQSISDIATPFKQGVKQKMTPSPTPFEFQELTVPYLRSKEYSSELGELQRYADNGNYASYLTTYHSEGLKVNGLLTVPKGEKPQNGWPAVIFIHGYIPPGQYKTVGQYSDYVDYIARNGFVVFKIDLRGHGSSEGTPSGAYFSPDYIVDTLNAYSALQSSGLVDPEKIGLWGHSMAGNVVMRSLVVKPEIRAAVIWAGAVYTYEDFREYGIDDNSYQPPGTTSERQRRRQRLMDLYGQPDLDHWFWKQVAPVSYLDDLKGAVQLHHAANDDVVDIRYSRNLNEMLNKTAVKHELKEYPDGGHNLSGSIFTQAMESSVEFFKKTLN